MGFDRLKKNQDFKRVYSKGKSYGCKNLVIYYLPNNEQNFRVGFSISKKVGNAVTRNRIRRYLKESLLQCHTEGRGYDIIFIARVPAKEDSFFDIKKSTLYLFKKVGLKIYENTKQVSDSDHQILPSGNFSAKRANL